MRARWIAAIAVVTAALAVALLIAGLGGEEATEAPATRAHALALGADARAVAAIERLDRSRWRAALARERRDGSLDPHFADLPLEHPVAITRQDDGKLLVAGERVTDGRRLLAVTRVTAGGRIDPGFGTRGIVTVAAGDGDAVARGVAIERDRDVVVVGDADFGGRAGIAVARIGGDGRRSDVRPIRDATAAGAAQAADGAVVVAGTDTRDGSALLARLRPGDRPAITRAPTRLTTVSWRAVAAMADGGAVVVGSGRNTDARSLVAIQPFSRSGSARRRHSLAAGDGDAYGAAAVVATDGSVTVGATGVRGQVPTAFALRLDAAGNPARAPVRIARGRLAAIAPGGGALVTRWDGRRQRAFFVRP